MLIEINGNFSNFFRKANFNNPKVKKIVRKNFLLSEKLETHWKSQKETYHRAINSLFKYVFTFFSIYSLT